MVTDLELKDAVELLEKLVHSSARWHEGRDRTFQCTCCWMDAETDEDGEIIKDRCGPNRCLWKRAEKLIQEWYGK